MSVNNEFLKYEEDTVESSDVREFKGDKPRGKRTKKSSPSPQDELDKIFHPVTVTEDGKSRTMRVSSKQATVFEIFGLQDALDEKLGKLKNEHEGFSYEIREIYNQLFDELIRQEIIACPERGKLLKNIKDEALRSLESLRKGYKSSFSYAVCKDLLSRRSIINKRREIPEFIEQIRNAEETINSMKNEWEEKKRLAEDEEQMKMIERTFLENQLVRANEEMAIHLENHVDTEHRWLRNLDQENTEEESETSSKT